MEKVSLVAAMGDGGGLAEVKPSGRGGTGNRVVELRPLSVREGAEFEDGAEDFRTRRRSGTPPVGGVANSPRRALKPVSMIFAPPNNLARFYQTRAGSDAGSITVPCVGEVRWKSRRDMVVAWMRNPGNWAVAVWGVAVFISGAILFMVMVGMLNGILTRKVDRDLWFEASNQSINALFTLFVLLLHPLRLLHLVWLLRWRRKDIPKLRDVYCKGGAPKPNEWLHMLVVLLLYQLNCFAQYAVCALNWYYSRAQRPVAAVMVCFVTALSAGCAAGIYTNVSPLGKDSSRSPDDDDDDDGATLPSNNTNNGLFFQASQKYDRLLERQSTLGGASRAGTLVENPQWQGGLFDCWQSPSLVAATICCFPCVLGHNLSRLGFGNRYVHVATFLLACFAPFVIFEMAAVNVDSSHFRQFLRASGVIVGICGLFYGGYWRLRMRETYNLPTQTSCPIFTDFTQWLMCSCCSVCQEVRTAEAFDISNGRFYVKAQTSALSSPLPDTARQVEPAEEHSHSQEAPPSSLQPLPVSSVVRITEIALSNISDTVLEPPRNQNV